MKKISVPEVLEITERLETIYSKLQQAYIQDEQFYELDFQKQLNIPIEFENAGIVLPTARDMVDTFVDNIDIANARVKVPAIGSGKSVKERAEMMRKFYLGVLYRTNVENEVSPWHVAAKHAAKHGFACLKTVYDAARAENEPGSLPIVIQAINPYNIMPDPSYGGRQYVIERHNRICSDVRRRYPKWGNPTDKKQDDFVKFVSYWDKDFRCDLIEGEPILKVPVAKHNYGFIPYTIIDSGLGDISIENKPEERYVGILRYMFDLLVSESRNYSISDIVLAQTAWPWFTVEGEDTASVTEITQKFGTVNRLPPGVKVVPQISQTPPDALNQHLYRTSDYIAAHAATRSTRGLGESNVRSGADRRLVIAQGANRYQYTSQAFQYGAAQVLMKCALLTKNVIPEGFNVWAKTPNDEFDIEIKKEDMVEPFNCYVEFAPINPEDEYTRHDDLERLVQGHIVPVSWARSQMPNVDPIAMEREDEREKLRNSPMVTQIVEQYAAGKLAEAIAKRQMAEQPMPPPGMPQQGMPPQGMGQPPMNPQQIPLQGGMIPPTTNRMPLGGAGDMQNQLGQMRSQSPMYPGQGQGINAGGDKR